MAREIELKYGVNPNQKPARIFMEEGELPLKVLSGHPGYINFLDALNGWQLVSELKRATGMPAAASFKHVSPAGAAVGEPLDDVLRKMYFIDPEAELSPLACAYARARGSDRLSSYGDFISLSDVCDVATAKLIARKCPTASSPPATSRKRWRSLAASARAITTSSRSTKITCRRRWSARCALASPSSRGATRWS